MKIGKGIEARGNVLLFGLPLKAGCSSAKPRTAQGHKRTIGCAQEGELHPAYHFDHPLHLWEKKLSSSFFIRIKLEKQIGLSPSI